MFDGLDTLHSTCKFCRETKPIELFHKQKRTTCNQCRSEIRRSKYQKRVKVTAPAIFPKECSKCGEKKGATEFGRSNGKLNKVAARCKNCLNADSALYRKDLRSRNPISEIIGDLQCRVCKEVKPASNFSCNMAEVNGRSRLCRSCSSTASKATQKKAHAIAGDITHTIRRMVKSARTRAKMKGVICDIDDVYISKNFALDRCPIMGIPFVWDSKCAQAGSPSLDQIVPGLGYRKGNVQLICHLANTMKSNANLSELRRFGEWAIEFTSSRVA